MKQSETKGKDCCCPVESPKSKAEDFVSNSSAHGLKVIFQSDKSLVRRSLWAVLFLSSVVAMAYMIYASCVNISSYPFSTVTSISLSSPITFPSLTVCNINPVDLSSLSTEMAHWMDLVMSNPSLMESDVVEGVNISSVSLATNEELHGDITLSHDTFFTACRYGGEDLNCTDLFHGEYQLDKQCYVLQNEKLKKATPRTALTLTIFINQAGYLSVTETAGVMFRVHAAGDTPDMTKPQHEAPTGFTTNVAVRMHQYHYLPPPYQAFGDSSCTDTDTEQFLYLMNGEPELYPGSRNTTYSLDACMNTRARVKTERVCNCTIGQTGTKYASCRLNQISGCYYSTVAAILDRAMASDLLGCPRPCHGHSYLPTISMSYFPSKNALARLKEKGVVRNITHARDHYLQLRVYLEDLMIHKTEHVPQYEWNTIMGLLGGNMGFFLGASVLTLAELFDFIICLLLLCCGKLCRRLCPRLAPSAQEVTTVAAHRKSAW